MRTVDVALKEWEVVTHALARGEQSILLRKGGIQEGPGGFSIEHRRFALLPTRLHQKIDMLKPPCRPRLDAEAEVEPATFSLAHAAEISDIFVVPSRESLDALDDLHVWDEPYLEMRWNYRPERPLYLLVVRAFALSQPTELTNNYEVAGCRSWVPLKGSLAVGDAVVPDTEHANTLGRVVQALSTLA